MASCVMVATTSPRCNMSASVHPAVVHTGWFGVQTTTRVPTVKRIMRSGAARRMSATTRRGWNVRVASSKAATTSPSAMVSMGRPETSVPAGKHSSTTSRCDRAVRRSCTANTPHVGGSFARA